MIDELCGFSLEGCSFDGGVDGDDAGDDATKSAEEAY